MATFAEPTVPSPSRPFLATLTRVRRRWRWRHAAVGAAVSFVILLLAFGVAAGALQAARFSPESIRVARWVLGLLALGVVARGVIWPLARRVPDRELALYVEGRVPELDGAVLTAVEVASREVPDASQSAMLTRGLYADAARRLTRSPSVDVLERPATVRAAAMVALVIASGIAMVMLGPSWVGESARLLLTPWREVAAAPFYAIDVTPGNATVARGSDFQVSAQLRGFESQVVELAVRRGAAGTWERLAMGPAGDSSRFTARLFDVAEDAEYYVESNGVRSAPFTLTVRDLPAVRRMALELRYPTYTGLASDVIDDGGDIAAVKGTRASVHVHATRAVRGGRLVLDGDSTVNLTRMDDSTLTGTLSVRRDGFYRVELEAPDGTRVAGNVDYVIDALDDLAPQVAIRKPGRDVRPSNVEEVLIEVEASDDFGIGKLELHYQINGGEEKTIVLSEGSGRRPRELTAGQTLFLEEMSLQPGDVISYYAKAWDNDAVSGPKSAMTDIYFLTIRPFDREYRQNQQGGGGGGGPSGENPGTLVARQREIVAATFKSERDRPTPETAGFRSDVTTIQLAQGKLREDVQQTLTRLQRPAVQATDTTFRVMAELMPKVIAEMQAAEAELSGRKLKNALAPEQRALQLLERVDALFREVQVSMQNAGGGGGGGGNSNAEDLADLFELETDKLRNQYEEVQRGAQQQANREVDETLERLKRLAARQQQEAERQRQRAQAGSGGSGGGSQRQMAEEAEQLARRLERLAREQNSPEMEQTARALQQAATSMRQQAVSAGGSQGGNAGSSAREQLERARRLLEQSRGAQTARGVEGAADRARRLADQQREVREEVGRLGQGADRAGRLSRLDDRKEQMASEVRQLAEQLDQLSRDAMRERGDAARRLRDAAGAIRQQRVEDMIRYSREFVRRQSPETADNLEAQIGAALDSVAAKVGSAVGAVSSDSTQRVARSLAQARDLVRGLSSIEERMRERSGGSAGEPGGRDGESASGQRTAGQLGAPGQQGAAGQQGDAGQQGQQGEGGQQGQQGGGQPGEGARQGDAGGRGEEPMGESGRGQSPLPGANRGQPGGSGQGAAFGGRLSAEDARQFARELRGQRESAEALRRDLARDGISTADLDRLISRLRQLESGRSFNDPEELARLRSAVVEGFKEFEFSLRRQLGSQERDGPVLGGGSDVPPGYRDLVSEYFRSLSRKGKP